MSIENYCICIRHIEVRLSVNIVLVLSRKRRRRSTDEYELIVQATITTPAICHNKEPKCHIQTANNIKNNILPVLINQNDGSSREITLEKPTVNIVDTSGKERTTRGNLIYANYFLSMIILKQNFFIR